MGDGGAGGGGGYGLDLDTGELTPDLGEKTSEMSRPDTTQSESAFGYGVPGSESAISSLQGGVTGGVEGAGGAGGLPEKVPEPRAWEKGIENAAEKGEQRAAITRKKRRRTLLTPEEGGIMQSYPVYRRSILGI